MINWFKKNKRNNKSGAMILMYHRVANLKNDPWNLAVSPDNFKMQMKELAKYYTIFPLSELHAAMTDGIKNPIAITFDDGYADNYQTAMPILDAEKIPASFFICTGNTESQKHFWWDELQQIFFDSPVLPRHLELTISEEKKAFDFSGEEILTTTLIEKLAQWKYPEPVHSKRITVFLAIWLKMKPLLPNDQQTVLVNLRDWSNFRKTDAEDFSVMPESSIQQASANSLFCIGAHSVSHPTLSNCEKELQKKEILNSRIYLERITGKLITHFAYPFGDFNASTSSILKEAGFTLGLTTERNVITRKSKPFEWARYQVTDMPGKDFTLALKKMLNIPTYK